MRPKHFDHQRTILERTADLPGFALFWEQGTGKTRPVIETAMHLRDVGEIDTLFVLAPSGVHRAWVTDEIPKWFSGPGEAFFYSTGRAATQKHQRMLAHALTVPFLIIAMSYDSFMTVRGKTWAKKLFSKRRVLYVLDESTEIKTPSAKRTISITASGRWAPYRRIMTGTPSTNSPFDLYTQIRFVDPTFWPRHGFPDYFNFKTYFGIWEKGINRQGPAPREYEFVKGYRHLDELHEMIQPLVSRVTKDEVLDLPPKLYSKRYFDLSPEQQRVYDELRSQHMTLLSSGDLLTAELAITRLLRFAQVTSNYFPSEPGAPSHVIDPKHHPRLETLLALAKEVSHQAIIWARFHHDIDSILERLGKNAVRYDGLSSEEDRAAAKERFQAGEVQFFVGNPAAGGKGLTLTAARTVIYYNNDFSLENRLQSEDRAHRIGQMHPVDYVDIVAPGTVDVKIVQSLRSNVNIAAAITGDRLKEWI